MREVSPAGHPWVAAAIELARTPSSVYAGDRKIHVGRTVELNGIDPALAVEHAGYTPAKMRQLIRHYPHEEARASAAQVWRARRRSKTTSVPFHTFNHLVKTREKHGVGSVGMGPCMLSVSVASVSGRERVEVHYRSVEFFRAFVADLVFLRDVLLEPFDLQHPIVRFHFASVTCHPRDLPFVLCNAYDPFAEVMALKRADRRFHDKAVKWLAAYLDVDGGYRIDKYDSAQRRKRAVLRMMPPDDADDLREYCRRHVSTR